MQLLVTNETFNNVPTESFRAFAHIIIHTPELHNVILCPCDLLSCMHPMHYHSYQVFKGQEYHSLGSLSESVPILSCCSLSKRYLIPGWRCGWLAIYDKQGLLGEKASLQW